MGVVQALTKQVTGDVDLAGVLGDVGDMRGAITEMRDLLRELVAIERARAEHDGITLPAECGDCGATPRGGGRWGDR